MMGPDGVEFNKFLLQVSKSVLITRRTSSAYTDVFINNISLSNG